MRTCGTPSIMIVYTILRLIHTLQKQQRTKGERKKMLCWLTVGASVANCIRRRTNDDLMALPIPLEQRKRQAYYIYLAWNYYNVCTLNATEKLITWWQTLPQFFGMHFLFMPFAIPNSEVRAFAEGAHTGLVRSRGGIIACSGACHLVAFFSLCLSFCFPFHIPSISIDFVFYQTYTINNATL